jgi:nifR3 family TIM-barrel protein
MKDPKKVYDIVYHVSRAIQKPVTVKIRKGFDAEHVNAVEVAKAAEAAGAAAVAVHGRTRAQYYSGNADWDIIAQVKDALSIPVIGNGDITTPQKAAQMLSQTGCDGVMIGRGAQGNPWIFKQITSYLETGTFPDNPSPLEVKRVIQRHAQLQQEVKGEYTAVREMRKHMSWYTTGYPNSAKFRQMINSMESMEELMQGLDAIFPEE